MVLCVCCTRARTAVADVQIDSPMHRQNQQADAHRQALGYRPGPLSRGVGGQQGSFSMRMALWGQGSVCRLVLSCNRQPQLSFLGYDAT